MSSISVAVPAASCSSGNSADPKSLICRYYARGICRFGDMCRFIHTAPVVGLELPLSTGGSAIPSESASMMKPPTDPTKWVLAPVFVPRNRHQQSSSNSSAAVSTENHGPNCPDLPSSSAAKVNTVETYASVVMGPEGASIGSITSSSDAIGNICPYQSNCPYGDLCVYEHNDLCEMCGLYALHPTDKQERKSHVAQCIQQHEKDMELSFAVARSKDKTCGICFEIIMEKAGREQRFGILPNCNHIFCLECIRKWRQAKQFDNKIIRACPECRIPSDYICPSAFWVESKDEKEKLLTDYKNALGEKDCKYFKKGEGKCPFGNKCFYKHALPDGERVDVGVPKRNKRKIQRAEDEILDLFDLYLWDFVDRREFRWFEYISSLSDSGESDWSEEFD